MGEIAYVGNELDLFEADSSLVSASPASGDKSHVMCSACPFLLGHLVVRNKEVFRSYTSGKGVVLFLADPCLRSI